VKTYSFTLAAAMMIAGSAVFAQTAMTANDAIATVKEAYAGTNFSRIEVRTGLTQIKVEAFSGKQKVEVILDKATGKILKRETEAAGIFENTKPGEFFSARNRDFLDADDDDNSNDDDDLDDSDDDSSDDDSSDDDSSDDDNSSDSDDSDDDSNDDNGGDRDRSDDRDDDRDDDDSDDD
jgi:hypothetical protein